MSAGNRGAAGGWFSEPLTCTFTPPAVELWSGIGKGPPRKLKFPQPEDVVEALKSSLA